MFSTRQKLFLGGAVLLSVLLVAGSYFGSRWLFGPDVEPTPERLLTAEPAVVTSLSPDTLSVSGTDWVSELEASLSDTDPATESDSIQIDEGLEAQLAALSDEEFTALAEALEQDEGESSKYPAVPEGYPENLTPVWLKDYFDEDLYADHVILGRVAIELWNQGERGFVNVVGDGLPVRKVYLLYPDVVYVSWNSSVREGPDGEPIEVPYISSWLGTPDTVEPLLNSEGRPSTEPPSGVEYVKFSHAGYDPATILDDY